MKLRIKKYIRLGLRLSPEDLYEIMRYQYIYQDKDGYWVCCTKLNYTPQYIHRIVAERMFGKLHSGIEVNHIDKDKGNCTRDNLEPVSKWDNIQHRDGKEYEVWPI